MMHLTLLHVPNLGVNVIIIVEAIFLGGCLHLGRWGGKNIFLGGSIIFIFNFKSECGTAQLSLRLFALFSCSVDMLPSSSSSTSMSSQSSYVVQCLATTSPIFDQSEAQKLSKIHRQTQNQHTVRRCSMSSACKNVSFQESPCSLPANSIQAKHN